MEVRWLGWAGVELEAEGERIVVDALDDARAVFAWVDDRAPGWTAPSVLPARTGARAGLITHLHRDHADAGALAAALAPGAPVLEPERGGGEGIETLALVQAEGELDASGLERRRVAPWATLEEGPFRLTALPAVDGIGDPQISWLIEAAGRRVLHLGDTMFHGWWWRIAARFGAPDLVIAPINGAQVSFPNRRPASPFPAAMGPDQALAATALLGAGRLMPIHYGGYEIPGVYEPVPDALDQLLAKGERVLVPELGEPVTL